MVDQAEIPTLQQRPLLDADADGVARPRPRRGAGADAECAARRRAASSVAVDGHSAGAGRVHRRRAGPCPRARPGWSPPGVECRLAAPAALAGPATVEITNGYLADRIGWREITAAGEGVRLAASAGAGGHA